MRYRLLGAPEPPAADNAVREPSASVADQPPVAEQPSLAVLPFLNLSGDREQEYFADVMVEKITTALARVRWLSVVARNSSFTYKGRNLDLKQVGRELGVVTCSNARCAEAAVGSASLASRHGYRGASVGQSANPR